MSTKDDRQQQKAARLERNSEMARMRDTGATLEEIGRHFGMTRERVRQILKKQNAITADEPRARRVAETEEEDQGIAAAIRTDLLANPGSTSDEIAGRLGIKREEVTWLLPSDVAALVVKESRTAGVQRWSDESILEALRHAATYEYPLAGSSYGRLIEIGEVTGPSRALIGKRFGNWSRACELAGIEPDRTAHDGYQSRWTDADMLGYVNRYLRLPGSGGTYAGYADWSRRVSDAPSGPSIRNRLGSWAEIKRQALGHQPLAEREETG